MNQSLSHGIKAEEKGSLAEAEWHYRQAAHQGEASGYFNLALMTLKGGDTDNAENYLEQYSQHQPMGPDALRLSGYLNAERGYPLGASWSFKMAGQWSESLFFALHDGEDWTDEHRIWAHTLPQKALPKLNWDGKRPLRIGYVGYGAMHTVLNFLHPVLKHHTEAFQIMAVGAGANLACVRDVKLDIAVDLLGHLITGPTQHLFAEGIAPLQFSYIGYPCDTGLSSVLRITDNTIDPPGYGNLIRLSGCAYAFAQTPGSEIEPEAVPHRGIVFASFNRICKITPATAQAWASIISADNTFRIKVLAHGGEKNTGARKMLESHGIPGRQLELMPKIETQSYLGEYNKVDVILDVIDGYSGMTTICDALYMGVPIVAHRGKSPQGRVAASLMEAAGWKAWVADSKEEYIRIALDAAKHRTLVDRRRNREMLIASPLMDGKRVAQNLEAAYLQVARMMAG